MQLLPELSVKIIKEVHNIIKEELIIVDKSGIITASTDQERIGNFHEGAVFAMKMEYKYYITKEKTQVLQGVKEGINLPIFFDNEVIGVIGITGDPLTVEPYADLIRKMTELMIKEAYHIEQKEWELRGLEAYFHEWVYAKEVDEEFIRKGQVLGVAIGTPYICAFVELDAKQSDKDFKQIQTYLLDVFKRHFPKKEDFMIRWGDGRFMVFKTYKGKESKDCLKSELKRCQQSIKVKYQANLIVGLSKSIVTYQIHKAYKEAEIALNVAKTKEGFIQYEDLLLDIVLEEIKEETSQEFIQRVLGRIRRDDELLATLAIYLNHDQSIKETASYMHIHTNTLHYRLKQIKKITGLDPRKTEAIALFYVAICLLKQDIPKKKTILVNNTI
ncbi:carbohydrate diacid regulator [Alteribacillus persepolensis]|uniref:Carbohydrate diacid regulator n=1 Tax=Alteribacillus persepolensis TaxID=568899 RepID=A0A1G8HTT6_9BACI|nr:sugar diacid recognition domain-containing protein [Alteribacillus persepolensis]SDI10034.1 carbohydrate diacid regulator [Alteribacillus persepolensis]